MKLKFCFFLLIFFQFFLLYAEEAQTDPWRSDFNYKEYRSRQYLVRVEPIKGFKCLQSHYNIIRISIYEYETKCFYYMHYVSEHDWNYIYNEYLNNSELAPTKEMYAGITETTINWFATDKISEILYTRECVPKYFYQSPDKKCNYAYGWTEKERRLIRESSSR